jgi:leader peptidase (prepilin peptidase)/N-methyltransferase
MVIGLVLVGLLGLVVGSFLNVAIYRVPRGESLVTPGSRCPACATPILPRHNVPVLGWLLLRGRCASCDAPISSRYPLVEAGTALVFLLVTWRLTALGEQAAIPAYLWFAGVGLALSLIDVDVKRLPDVLVLPSYPVLLLLLVAAAGWQGDWWALVRAVIGGAALYTFFLAVVLIHPSGMGFGDVKLAGIVGGLLAYLSWASLLIGAFVGFVLGAIVGLVLIAAGRAGRRTAIPFGPFMVGGALLAIFVADPLATWYADLIQL